MSIFFIALGILLAALVALGIIKKDRSAVEEDSVRSVLIDLPDADVPEVSDSKSEAITLSRSSRKSKIEEYYDQREESLLNPKEKVEDPVKSIGGETPQASSSRASGPVSSDDLFGNSGKAPAKTPDSRSSYRETPQEREARHQRRREEAIDMANELTVRDDITAPAEETPQRIEIAPPQMSATRQTGVISSLSGSGGGVSSLENPSGIYSCESDHPFKCVFPKGEKIKSGQRVSIRLLEDMLAGSYAIPRNTHLQAYVTIDSRLELEISSIEIGGHIVPLGCVAYDTDGLKGIYCPETGEIKRTVTTSSLGTVGSLVGGRVGRVAGEIVNTGVSIAQNASGERTVTVPAGYTFFIAKKKQQ